MPLIKYTGSQFLFNNPSYKSFCEVDKDFVPKLDIINASAKKYGIQIYTTSSYRIDSSHIKGAVVKRATMSNHFVGHAIDFNLLYKGKIYGSNNIGYDSLKDADKTNDMPPDILSFIKECGTKGVRWGGDFRKNDDIHFDDGINLSNPALWHIKYKEHHP